MARFGKTGGHLHAGGSHFSPKRRDGPPSGLPHRRRRGRPAGNKFPAGRPLSPSRAVQYSTGLSANVISNVRFHGKRTLDTEIERTLPVRYSSSPQIYALPSISASSASPPSVPDINCA